MKISSGESIICESEEIWSQLAMAYLESLEMNENL